jgi:hypothetical protein
LEAASGAFATAGNFFASKRLSRTRNTTNQPPFFGNRAFTMTNESSTRLDGKPNRTDPPRSRQRHLSFRLSGV